jgi:hypothetical protein
MTKTKLSIQENEAAEEMAKKIERYIEQYDYVTFAELSNHIAGFSAPANALACEFKLGSVLFWTNMTTPASQAIEKLFVERRICAKNTTALPYFVDGITLRANNWAPLVLRPGPVRQCRPAQRHPVLLHAERDEDGVPHRRQRKEAWNANRLRDRERGGLNGQEAQQVEICFSQECKLGRRRRQQSADDGVKCGEAKS